MNFWRFWQDTLDLLYPNACCACQELLVGNEDVICTRCRLSLPRTQSHLNPIPMLQNKFLGKAPIEKVYAFLSFSKKGKVQQLLHHLKYRNRPEVGEVLGNIYGQELKATHSLLDLDLLIPVPLHARKKKQRGYNQSEVLAKGLSQSTGIAFSSEILIRAKDTDTQTRKTRIERFENVSGIFEVVNPSLIKGKKIGLVDDVLTTGSTLESAAGVLLQHGAAEIIIITLAAAY
ncbi:MAG: ComF family protein [Runella sp.]